MAVEVDHYAVIGVPKDADSETVEAAVKKSMREWRKRTEASDLGVRQEAEVKVKQIEDARRTLLDKAKRAVFDRALAGGVKTAQPTNAAGTGEGGSWLDRAEAHLAEADYHSAAYAAREATHHEGTNARTWWIRSRANAGLGLWHDALYEAKQAVQIEDGNPEFHFNLGLVHEQMDSYGEAINSYRRAGTCDPGNLTYELAVGGVHAMTGKLQEALGIFERVYAKNPADPTANYYLGSVLLELAEAVPARRSGDSYMVTSQEEVTKMRSYVERATSLKAVDSSTRQDAMHISNYLDEMEKKSFRPPWKLMAGAGAAGMEAGFFGFMFMLTCAGALFFLPIIFIFVGFGMMSDGQGSGFLVVLLGALLCWVWFMLMYVPRWKQNKRNA